MTSPTPRAHLKWVGVDLDGTLAEPVWTPANPTSRIGDPMARNVAKLRAVVEAGYKIHIHTSRPWTDFEAIEFWLNLNAIPWDAIQCGKPLYALYIDDRGRHESATSWVPGT